jgi:lysophospholipase L1-like esterase
LYELLHFAKDLSLKGIFGGFQRYNEILNKMAKDEGTQCTDNSNQIGHLDEHFVDRVHFSRLGSEAMAMNFLPAVLGQLDPQRAEPQQGGQ